jgi:hypothetical protein
MFGHNLKVVLDKDTVCLSVVCNESEGSFCRRACVEDCDEVCRNPDEHVQPVNYCLAVEWINADNDVPECYAGDDTIPLYDGMPIKIEWNGDFYEWSSV